MPKVRMQAVHLVYQGWSTRKVGHHFGVGSSAISKWIKKDKLFGLNGWRPIPTESSKPHHHSRELSEEIIERIVVQRKKHDRCAEVVCQDLINQGVLVNLSSVKRTLDRQGLIKKCSPWKRWHFSLPRPEPINAGDLAQIDTIHITAASSLHGLRKTLEFWILITDTAESENPTTMLTLKDLIVRYKKNAWTKPYPFRQSIKELSMNICLITMVTDYISELN